MEGIDQSGDMIAQVAANYPHIPFRVADARTFEVSAQVNAVFSNATLHWIPEASKVIGAVRQALLPSGRFVAEMGGKGNIQKIKDAIRVGYELLSRKDFDSRKPWYYPSAAEYASLLEEQGFEIVYLATFDRPTPLAGADGFKNWVRMFAGAYLADLTQEEQVRLLNHAEDAALSTLLGPDGWHADYRRLRFVAKRID